MPASVVSVIVRLSACIDPVKSALAALVMAREFNGVSEVPIAPLIFILPEFPASITTDPVPWNTCKVGSLESFATNPELPPDVFKDNTRLLS